MKRFLMVNRKGINCFITTTQDRPSMMLSAFECVILRIFSRLHHPSIESECKCLQFHITIFVKMLGWRRRSWESFSLSTISTENIVNLLASDYHNLLTYSPSETLFKSAKWVEVDKMNGRWIQFTRIFIKWHTH
jgi:hypothetical protein